MVFTLICAIGGHWVFLQSIAWVGMVVSYSQDATLTVALQKTFDGRHPCRLCKFVEHGKQAQEKQEVVKTETKLDFLLAQPAPALIAPAALPAAAAVPRDASIRPSPPPTPPPRLA